MYHTTIFIGYRMQGKHVLRIPCGLVVIWKGREPERLWFLFWLSQSVKHPNMVSAKVEWLAEARKPTWNSEVCLRQERGSRGVRGESWGEMEKRIFLAWVYGGQEIRQAKDQKRETWKGLVQWFSNFSCRKRHVSIKEEPVVKVTFLVQKLRYFHLCPPSYL